MAAPAYLPLFGSDYLADTSHLTTEEHGAYLLLMIAAWRQDDCGLPNDDRKLARITGLSPRKWAAIKDTILEFWTLEDGRIFQARLRKERGFADQKSEGNRRSARARWDKQVTENNEGGECERISERNAPQPQPQIEEPNGSPIPPTPTAISGEPDPEPKAGKRTAKSAAPSSVRMTDDWKPAPLPATVLVLVELWPPGRLDREIDQFRDYWLDRTDKRPGWDRTFHNRIRDIHDRVLREARHDRSSNTGRQPAQFQPRDSRDAFERRLDERIFAGDGGTTEGVARTPERPPVGDGQADRRLPAVAAPGLR